MPPEIVLFVFRRRGTRTISVRRTCWDAGNLVGSLLGMPRRRKTKRRGTISVSPYKQATPGWPVYRAKRKLYPSFLFFGGAAFPKEIPPDCQRPNRSCAQKWSGCRAAEKQKERSRGASVAINRPPLRGFEPPERWPRPCDRWRFTLVSVKNPLRRCG